MTARRVRPRIQVRDGPRGRTLRVDGTYASWYAPGRATTGSVWDALVAPLLWLPKHRRRKILVLGLGGGSAARLARAVAPRARIVGVELDREVLRAARRWFDLDELGVDVVQADALAYLRRARGHFDAVLDDVFVGRGRAVRKPDWLEEGLALAARRVGPGGILACNTLDEAPRAARALAAAFPSVVRIGVREFDNRIVVAGPRTFTGRGLRAAASAEPLLAAALPRLSFRRASV